MFFMIALIRSKVMTHLVFGDDTFCVIFPLFILPNLCYACRGKNIAGKNEEGRTGHENE